MLGVASPSILIVLIVVITIVSVVAVPLSIISNMFGNIGNKTYTASGNSRDLRDMLNLSLQQAEVQNDITNHWASLVAEERDIAVPLSYIVVTQFLAGVEYDELNNMIKKEVINATKNKHVTYGVDDEGHQTIEISYTVATELEFATRVKRIEPFRSKLVDVEAKFLSSYLIELTEIYHHTSLPVEFIENNEGFLYPLSKLAHVTA